MIQLEGEPTVGSVVVRRLGHRLIRVGLRKGVVEVALLLVGPLAHVAAHRFRRLLAL